MRILLTIATTLFLSSAAFAQQATPEGDWRDEFGTWFEISLCGDGTQLCAILNDVQGESRTEENLAFLNQQVLQASQTDTNEWQGTVIYDGNTADATVTQVAPDVIEITGCRGIFCDTLVFSRG